MDYIQNELFRQRRLWSTLLLGKPRREEPAGEVRPESPAGISGWGDSSATDGRWTGAGRTGGARGGRLFGTAEQAASGNAETVGMDGETAARTLMLTLREQSRRRRVSTAQALERRGGAWPAGETGGGAPTGSATGETGGTDPAAWAGESLRVFREMADPKALSRAFQRDARRYDGGFPLY